MDAVYDIALQAKQAKAALNRLTTNEKNDILLAMAEGLLHATPHILACNAQDVKAAEAKGHSKALIDRLSLSEARIRDMAQGLVDVSKLPDPVGEIINAKRRPNGLLIGKRRVPMGVIGIIYEARPNVTADAIGLCIKTSNAVVLKGSSDALKSNIAVCEAMTGEGEKAGLPQGAVGLVRETSREAATYMMGLNGLIDVLIPRGGSGLIQSVVKNATIPVIETGVGNCHIFVDASADFEMAAEIVVNAKTSRPAVCNAAESLLVHGEIADTFLPVIIDALTRREVELVGCEVCRRYGVAPATEEDYATEYHGLKMSVKVVEDVDEAISHINTYGSAHSDAIITNSYENAQRFKDEVDSAAVYVNASTRFTDGFEFGFGAEIGISTQRLHARGPMGLEELTTVKYVIDGNGQIR